MMTEKLQKTIKQAKESVLYRTLLNGVLWDGDIKTFHKIPFTSKQDLRDYYPYKTLAVNVDEIVEVHTSSGTTGKSTLSFFTKKDLLKSSHHISQAWKNFGITKGSKVQFMMSYGLFSGAALNSYAIQLLGGMVIPAGIQTASKQIELLQDFEADVIVGTPGYYYYLYDYMMDNNIPLSTLNIKTGIMAGEVYSDELREDLESKFKIDIYDHYGLCEINTGIAFECKNKNGLHLLVDYVYTEIIDPETGDVLPLDTEGELVLTTLDKEASPVIRYRTGDITTLTEVECICGHSGATMRRILRRTDDLIFVKGIKINPHELKENIMSHFADSVHPDIKIILGKLEENKRPKMLVSPRENSPSDILLQIQTLVKNSTMVTFEIEEVDQKYFQRGEQNKVKFVEYVS